MSVGAAVRSLGRFLEECEAERTVSSVTLTACDASSGPGPVTAEITVAVSPQVAADRPGAVTLADATVGADGTLQFTFESVTPVGSLADHDVEVHSSSATVDGDGTISLALSVSVPADDTDAEPTERAGAADAPTASVDADATDVADATDDDGRREPDAEATSTSTPVSARDRDVPPFRDPDLLQEVYDSCDTFAEMTEALGMDVTAETVRRYMVDYDIHQPNSYDTGSDETDADEAADDPDPGADGQSPVVIADGMGLPDDVTVDTLIETVKRSNTIYEVEQDVGIEREDALEMLKELNLLDLVVGRLATEAKRNISREEVVDRLREASATQ